MPKSSTQKHYQNRINVVWQYIQHNLDKRPSLDELAEVACISPFHLHRVFRAYTGESLSCYCRRLRLERAASQLQAQSNGITEIAYASGYETPAAFSKAFKRQYLVTPSEFRKEWQTYLSRYRYEPDLIKELCMDYKIENRVAQRVFYVRRHGDYMQSAPVAWQVMDEYAEKENLYNEKTQMIGICHDSPELTEKDKIRYDACIPADEAVAADGEFGIQMIRGGDYAVFMHEGPYEKLIDTYDQISNEWIANQERELDDAPVFEVYLNPELIESDPDALMTRIYFPLK